jgi:redox-sensitive bicupin YhaK (pirin superfamily)
MIGGAHPHAGIETVTLILEGSVVDRDEGELSAGDVVWMNAGRGIIHNEAVEVEGRSRVLQLWIRLPARDRALAPSFEIVRGRAAPVRREPGVTARLYSGSTGTLVSSTKNRAPITLVDIALAPGARFCQQLPRRYNGFLYMLDGALEGGGAQLSLADVAWLDRPSGDDEDTLELVAGERGARVVLYAGEPQHEPLVHYGPFVGGSRADIEASVLAFRRGQFVTMSSLAPSRA